MRRKDIPKIVNKNICNIIYRLLGQFQNKAAFKMVVSTLRYFFIYLCIYLSILFMHGTIIRTGITCKKIPCYMRDSTCRWFIVKKAKIF